MDARGAAYPVIWAVLGGESASGQLLVDGDVLRLRGSMGERLAAETVAFEDLESVRIGRRPEERLNGKPALLLERRGAPALLVRALGPGLFSELGDLLAELQARPPTGRQQIAIVLPLDPGSLEEARALLAEGPPFDPALESLQRHEVFLSGHEAVFVFTGRDACESIRRISAGAAVWPLARRWHDCLAAPPRIAESAYVWPPRSASPSDEGPDSG